MGLALHVKLGERSCATARHEITATQQEFSVLTEPGGFT